MRHALGSVLLLLAACSPKTEVVDEVASSEPVAVVDVWSGSYSGDLMVRINNAAGTYRVVFVTAAADGCTGDIGLADGGVAAKLLSADHLEAVIPIEGAAACTIRLHRSGDTLSVTEDASCAAFHGTTCAFKGTATRVK